MNVFLFENQGRGWGASAAVASSLSSDPPTLIHLRRDVRGSAYARLGKRIVTRLGVSKVTNLQMRRRSGQVHQGVLQLEVSVHDSHAMQILDARHEVLEKVTSLRLVERTMLLHVIEELAAAT